MSHLIFKLPTNDMGTKAVGKEFWLPTYQLEFSSMHLRIYNFIRYCYEQCRKTRVFKKICTNFYLIEERRIPELRAFC